LRLPALSLLPGHSLAQEARLAESGNRAMLLPTSATRHSRGALIDSGDGVEQLDRFAEGQGATLVLRSRLWHGVLPLRWRLGRSVRRRGVRGGLAERSARRRCRGQRWRLGIGLLDQFLDPSARLHLQLFERAQVLHQGTEHETVVLRHRPQQRFAQLRKLAPQGATGQLGQLFCLLLPRTQRLEHGPSTDPKKVAGHRARA
jgi:hypothetical protein